MHQSLSKPLLRSLTNYNIVYKKVQVLIIQKNIVPIKSQIGSSNLEPFLFYELYLHLMKVLGS